MTHEQVDEILKHYQQYKGRCAYLKLQWERLKGMFDREMAGACADDYQTVSASIITGVRSDGHVSDKTAFAALDLAQHTPTQAARALMERMEKIDNELQKKRTACECADAWLCGLRQEEAFIIRHHAMEQSTWRKVLALYQETFAPCATVDMLKKMKKNALIKIYEMAR